MYWLTRGLDFGGKLSCTGSLEAWILAANCYALAHYRPGFGWQIVMHWLIRGLDFGCKLIVMQWLTRGLNFGGK